MIKLVRQRLILDTVRKTMVYDIKNQRCMSSKDEKPPLCTEPPQQPQPCCAPNNDPPPCPPPPPPCGPPCPPPICTVIPDPNNPCNYCPPCNPDPDEPDMTRLKRLQCLYQQDDGVPTYLKGGPRNVYFFHALSILGGFAFLQSLFSAYLLITK